MFAAKAERLLVADVSLLSDAVLHKPNVSPHLASARALCAAQYGPKRGGSSSESAAAS